MVGFQEKVNKKNYMISTFVHFGLPIGSDTYLFIYTLYPRNNTWLRFFDIGDINFYSELYVRLLYYAALTPSLVLSQPRKRVVTIVEKGRNCL